MKLSLLVTLAAAIPSTIFVIRHAEGPYTYGTNTRADCISNNIFTPSLLGTPSTIIAESFPPNTDGGERCINVVTPLAGKLGIPIITCMVGDFICISNAYANAVGTVVIAYQSGLIQYLVQYILCGNPNILLAPTPDCPIVAPARPDPNGHTSFDGIYQIGYSAVVSERTINNPSTTLQNCCCGTENFGPSNGCGTCV